MHDSSPAIAGAAARFAAAAVAALIGVYRAALSPILFAHFGPACRFEPTCSAYARQALAQHGLIRGGYLAARRLVRCRPAGGWGYDPVPRRTAIGAKF